MNGRKWMMALGALSLMAAGAAPASAGLLDTVKERGFIKCGVSEGLVGFSAPNDAGQWVGFDVDACRATAAAIFGDPSKVEYVSLNSKDRFTALQSSEVDMLPRTTSWTLSRDTKLGLDFAAINYYDGQGNMVHKDLGVSSLKELDGATICARTGATTELNLADYFQTHGMKYTSVVFDKSDEIRKAYDSRRCDVMTGDLSQIAIRRSQMENPADHVLLPQTISKEPLAIAVRQGDSQWTDVVRWSFYAMLLGEEFGLTSDNVAEQKEKSTNPNVRRLLGVEDSLGEDLGVSQDWAYNIILKVGNYAESFDRNLGKKSPIGLTRGLNALYRDGGLMYAPPAK
ncbi:amino acid ABC transporter substrate-binding protein [Mesorhizobium sp. A623]